MKVVKSISNKLIAASTLVALSTTTVLASQVAADSQSDMGSMFLFSAGMVGLFAARKHMKHKAT